MLNTAGDEKGPDFGPKERIGLFLGPALFLIAMLVPMNGIETAARYCLAAAIWMAVWWITEAVPIPATSIMPLVLFPLLGIASAQDSAAPYANSNVMLFMGGFMLAQGIVKWKLHRRLSLLIIRAIGVSPGRITFGFMLTTAVLSMWISNTATAMALLPIGLAVSRLVAREIEEQHADIPTGRGEFNFGISLMLGIAFAATIGGLGTPIGSPPNVIFIGALNEMFPETGISFVRWMMFGVPLVAVLLPIAWLVLRAMFRPGFREIPGGMDIIEGEYRELGPWTRPEKAVMAVFSITALMWMLRSAVLNPYVSTMIDDSTIAIFGALLMFVLPISWRSGTFALDWEWAREIPWGTLLLFGGGLSLASTISSTGLAQWLSSMLEVFSGVPLIVMVLIIAVFTAFLSEITSNTATAAMMMPIMAALAAAIGKSPVSLMLAAALSASFVFMLPVGTPPNAVIYGSRYLHITDMIKGGLWIKLAAIVIGSLLIYLLAIPVFKAGM